MSKQTGTVVAAFGRQYAVRLADDTQALCYPRAKKSEIACGDQVEVVLNAPDQGVIEKILPRSSLFYRADQWKEKLIAANVTQVAIVVATEPSFSDELVTRCLCAAEAQDISALIVLNKCDLTASLETARELLSPFVKAGHAILEMCAKGNVSALKTRLADHTSLLVGQSGMGKSTLTNALVPDADAKTREISEVLDSGKHTTTHARLYNLPDGGALIDSPGLQSFGLAHLSKDQIEAGFHELRPVLGTCRFRDCRHLKEPDCAIRAAMNAGEFDPRRYATLMRLIDEHEVAREALPLTRNLFRTTLLSTTGRTMLKHIVMWRLKDNAHGNDKTTNARLMKEKLEALMGRIPELKKIEVGIDFSATEMSDDVVLYSEFEDQAALDAYQIHPEHQAVVAFIREAVTSRRLVDYIA